MTGERHERRLDPLEQRFLSDSSIDSVIRDYNYVHETEGPGQMDLRLEHNDNVIYVEYKCTPGYSQRKCARRQIRRAIRAGECDYGIYVAGKQGNYHARRVQL